MGSEARPPSPSLPGAWSSAWSCPESERYASNASERLKIYDRSLPPEEDFILGQPTQRAPHGIAKASSDDQVSVCNSDKESTNSDDFYSIISQQDADTTISLADGLLESEVDLVYADSAKHESPVSTTSLKLNVPLRDDIPLSHDVPSEASASCSLHILGEHPHLASDMSNLSSRSSVQARSSSSASTRGRSRRSSSCSSRSITFRKPVPDYPLHSSNPLLGYTNLDAYNDISSESVPYSNDFASSSNPRSIRRRRINRPTDSNSLDVPQFGGDEPWTLSLEPALTLTDSMTSRSSLSISSEALNTSPEDGEILERYFTSIASPASSEPISPDFSASPYQAKSLFDIYTDIATQRSGNALYRPSPQEETFFSPGHPSYGPDILGEGKSKNMIKKTKGLYTKFKKFIVSRGSKHPDLKAVDGQYISEANTHPGEDADIPTASRNTFSPSSSRTSWSFPRRGFQRSKKVSISSVARSSGTEIGQNHPSVSMDGVYKYGHQATPRTSKEIRPNRRFSLPAFTGPSSGSSASMPQNPDTIVRPLQRRQAASINSAR